MQRVRFKLKPLTVAKEDNNDATLIEAINNEDAASAATGAALPDTPASDAALDNQLPVTTPLTAADIAQMLQDGKSAEDIAAALQAQGAAPETTAAPAGDVSPEGTIDPAVAPADIDPNAVTPAVVETVVDPVAVDGGVTDPAVVDLVIDTNTVTEPVIAPEDATTGQPEDATAVVATGEDGGAATDVVVEEVTAVPSALGTTDGAGGALAPAAAMVDTSIDQSKTRFKGVLPSADLLPKEDNGDGDTWAVGDALYVWNNGWNTATVEVTEETVDPTATVPVVDPTVAAVVDPSAAAPAGAPEGAADAVVVDPTAAAASGDVVATDTPPAGAASDLPVEGSEPVIPEGVGGDEGNPVTEVTADLIEDAEAEKELVDTIDDIDEDEEELDEEADMVTQATEVSERLGQIAEIIKENIEDHGDEEGEDGLSEGLARIAEIATESLYARVGIVRTYSTVATENFDTANGRMLAKDVALEDISGNLRRIADSIIAAIKKTLEFAQALWQKYVLGITHARKGFAKLSKAAEAIKKAGNKPASTELSNERLFNALAIGDRIPTSGAELTQPIAITAKGVYGDLSDWSLSLKATVVAGIHEGVQEFNRTKGFKSVKFNIAPSPAPIPTGFRAIGNDDNGMRKYQGPELPGGKTYVFTSFVSDATFQNIISGFGNGSIGGNINTYGESTVAATSVATLTPDQVIDYCNAFDNVLKAVEASKLFVNNVKTGRSELLNVATQLRLVDKFSNSNMSEATRLLTGLNRFLDKVNAPLTNYILKTSYAALDYVKSSLKQYAVKEAELSTGQAPQLQAA